MKKKGGKFDKILNIFLWVALGLVAAAIAYYYYLKSKIPKADQLWLQRMKKEAADNFDALAEGATTLPHFTPSVEEIFRFTDGAYNDSIFKDMGITSNLPNSFFANWNVSWTNQQKFDAIQGRAPGKPEAVKDLREAFLKSWMSYWTWVLESTPPGHSNIRQNDVKYKQILDSL